MLELRNRILSLAADTIIQCRINLKEAQLNRFNELLTEIESKKLNAFDHSLDRLLRQILLKQCYDIESKIKTTGLANEEKVFVKVDFFLKKREEREKKEKRDEGDLMVQAESWVLEMGVSNQTKAAENFEVFLYLFEELIVFLNQRPLFIKYHKNQNLRLKYMIKHKMYLASKLSQLPVSESLFLLDKLEEQTRESRDFRIKLQCRFLHSLENLSEHAKLKSPKQEGASDDPVSRERKWSVGSEEKLESSANDKVYAFYDKDLDFTFISSDNEIFGEKKSKKLEEMQIQKEDDFSDCEFEMLVINSDEQFVEENECLFLRMKETERSYLDL